jgi:hypothetical protein
MALKATGVVILLKTKLLIVGDSVMGCFIKRREMVMRLPTRFHKLVTALRVPAINPSRDAATTRLCGGSFAGPFLPATRLALP